MTALFLIDAGLGGNYVNRPGNHYTYVAQRGASPDDFIEKVYQETPDRVITSMSILAHAAIGPIDNFKEGRTDQSVSGFILGRSVGDINLLMFQKLKSLFPQPKSYICNLLSCLQATNMPDYADPAGWGTSGKNLELCKLLAYYLNQYIRTANYSQHFQRGQTVYDSLRGGPTWTSESGREASTCSAPTAAYAGTTRTASQRPRWTGSQRRNDEPNNTGTAALGPSLRSAHTIRRTVHVTSRARQGPLSDARRRDGQRRALRQPQCLEAGVLITR